MLSTLLTLAVIPIVARAATSTSAAPSPTQSGLIKSCDLYYDPVAGDSCQGIVNKYNDSFTLAQFYSWNPAVGSSCTNLEVGYYVCVGVSTASTSTSSTTSSSKKVTTTTSTKPTTSSTTIKSSTFTTSTITTPSPIQTGMATNCVSFYEAVSGDTCASIASKYGSTFNVAQFEAWNPAVGSNCYDLLSGDYYCVSTSGATSTTSTSSKPSTSSVKTTTTSSKSTSSATKTTTTSKSTSSSKTTSTSSTKTSTTSAIPSPTQSGVVSNCDKFHLVAAGETCSGIETANDITSAQFLAWNTGVNASCTNLEAGYYCCIGV